MIRFAYNGTQIILQFESNDMDVAVSEVTGTDLSHRYFWQPGVVDQLMADEQSHLDNGNIATDGMLWALTDQQGTVHDLAKFNVTTGATSVVDHIIRDSFGKMVSESDPSQGSLIGWTGRPMDRATGLQNNWKRWYDAAIARWLSTDPISFTAGDANIYRYVANSPIDSTDPTGLDWQYWAKKAMKKAIRSALPIAWEVARETGKHVIKRTIDNTAVKVSKAAVPVIEELEENPFIRKKTLQDEKNAEIHKNQHDRLVYVNALIREMQAVSNALYEGGPSLLARKYPWYTIANGCATLETGKSGKLSAIAIDGGSGKKVYYSFPSDGWQIMNEVMKECLSYYSYMREASPNGGVIVWSGTSMHYPSMVITTAAVRIRYPI